MYVIVECVCVRERERERAYMCVSMLYSIAWLLYKVLDESSNFELTNE